MDELPHDHPLKRGRGSDIYFYEKHLADIFRLMKTEAWTVDSVGNKINEYLEFLPYRSEYIYQISKKGLYQKGDLKTPKLDLKYTEHSYVSKNGELVKDKDNNLIKFASRLQFMLTEDLKYFFNPAININLKNTKISVGYEIYIPKPCSTKHQDLQFRCFLVVRVFLKRLLLNFLKRNPNVLKLSEAR